MLNKIKKALVARKLFDNWLSLIIKYILSKIGLNTKLKARVEGCVFEVEPDVFARIVSRFSRGLIKSIKCVNGRLFVNDVEVDNVSDLVCSIETWPKVWVKVIGWRYDDSCKCWVKDGVRFRRIDLIVLSIFGLYGESEYSFIDVGNRDVVDVGAYVGDTAIYFALRGARRVIAIEPHPEAFREMIENIKLNNLEGTVIPVNAGLASRHGEICVENVDVERTISTYHKPGGCGTLVPAITLADVIEGYAINHSAVLKMDCEGCEFDIILNDYEHIRTFKDLVFEYHLRASSEPLSKLLEVLARDYLCGIVRMSTEIGIVHCVRR
jgi:FkbM family methyltransferase